MSELPKDGKKQFTSFAATVFALLQVTSVFLVFVPSGNDGIIIAELLYCVTSVILVIGYALRVREKQRTVVWGVLAAIPAFGPFALSSLSDLSD